MVWRSSELRCGSESGGVCGQEYCYERIAKEKTGFNSSWKSDWEVRSETKGAFPCRYWISIQCSQCVQDILLFEKRGYCAQHYCSEYTYQDGPADPTGFERNNVLFSCPEFGDRLIIGKICSIASDVQFIKGSANHRINSISI